MPDTAGKTAHVMVRFTPELHAEIKAFADEHDLSMAQVIRAALRRYLKDPSLEEVRPASRRGPCTCITVGETGGPVHVLTSPGCPQHAETVDA